LVAVGLIAADDGAVRECDPNWRRLLARSRRVGEHSPKIEQMRLFARVLGARDPFIGTVHERVKRDPRLTRLV